MKKMLILVVAVSLVAGAVFADEATLIDFSLLVADTNRPTGAGPNDDGEEPNQNERTIMDFGQNLRFIGSFTAEQRAATWTSLAIRNWEVVLSSSSRTIANMVTSHTREAPSNQFGTVMGVRVLFPVENFNSSAMVRPPFEIPAYEAFADDGGDDADEDRPSTRFEGGYGVVKNVGTIKSLAVNVYGLNFPHGLWTHIIDHEGNQRSMFMGYLNFDGWGELRWDNPQYIREVRNRDLRLYPLYPDSMPFIKFAGFEIRRDATKRGGDFITYFKDVKVTYDKAVLDTDRDIDDESVWKIIDTRENARSRWEMERFGRDQIDRFIDQQKQVVRDNYSNWRTDINGLLQPQQEQAQQD